MSYVKNGFRFGGPLTPVVKLLLILNSGLFVTQLVSAQFYPDYIETIFGLSYFGFFSHHYYWQIFTYMFLHGGWLHIIFNLLSLWMFGGDIEQRWGSKRFISYYIICGIGAGVFISIVNAYMTAKNPALAFVPTIGASGALYALLLAYGMTWPNREVLLYFLFPVKMKYLLIGFGLLEFFGTLNSIRGVEGNISHIGHVGGLVSGFILVMIYRKRQLKYSSSGNIFSRIWRKIRNRRKLNVINTRIRAKETIDRLLDKIAREGMSSLSSSERKELEHARKHYYPDNNDIIH